MLFDDEKRILSAYIYNDKTFKSGLSNFEMILKKNLNQAEDIENICKYKAEDEKYFKEVYERIILYIVNSYFNPNFKTERKYMKNNELYICSYIFAYFNEVFENKKQYDELNRYLMSKNDIPTNKYNNVGRVALKVYLASLVYLNKQGMITKDYINNVKENIKTNYFSF